MNLLRGFSKIRSDPPFFPLPALAAGHPSFTALGQYQQHFIGRTQPVMEVEGLFAVEEKQHVSAQPVLFVYHVKPSVPSRDQPR